MPSMRIVATCLFAISILVDNATAQQPVSRPAGQVGRASSFAVEFGGGTVTQYVSMLKQQRRINISVHPSVADVTLPAVHLPLVTDLGALQWVQGITAGSERAIAVQTYGRGRQEPGTEVFILTRSPSLQTRSQQRGPESSDRETRAYSIKALIEGSDGGDRLKPDVVETSVKDIINAPGADQRDVAIVKYHSTSGLLTVYGRPKQIALATQVIDAMAQGRQVSILRRLQVDLDRLKGEVDDLKKRGSTTK